MPQMNSNSPKGIGLWCVKALQFTSSFADVAWNRFQPLLYLQQGYTPQQIGMLKSISFGTKFFMSPVWSLASDARNPVAVLLVSYSVGIVSLWTVRYMLLVQAPFWIFIIVRMLRSASNAVSPLRDAITIEYTSKRKDDESYGRQRMFASLAWGIGSFVGGYFIDTFSLWVIFPFTLCMTVITMSLLVFIFIVRERESGVEREKKASKKASPGEIILSIKTLFQTRSVRLFTGVIALLGFVMVLVDSVLPLQIEDLGGSRSFSGLTTLFSICGGIPVFWFSKKIFLRSGGGWQMLRLAMLIIMIRLPFLSFFIVTKSDLWKILPIQFFHGTTFALLWCGATDYLQSHAPSNITASTQTILSTCYFTLGQGFGNVFWMSIYSWGPRSLYVAGALITSIVYVLCDGAAAAAKMEKQHIIREEGKNIDDFV